MKRVTKRSKDEVDFAFIINIPTKFVLVTTKAVLVSNREDLYEILSWNGRRYRMTRMYKCTVVVATGEILQQEYYTSYRPIYPCLGGPLNGKKLTKFESAFTPPSGGGAYAVCSVTPARKFNGAVVNKMFVWVPDNWPPTGIVQPDPGVYKGQ